LAPNGKGEAFLFLEDFVTNKQRAPEVLASRATLIQPGQTYCDSPSWVIPFGIDPTQTYFKLFFSFNLRGELGLTTHSVDRSSILTLGGNKERLQRSHQGLPSDRGRHFSLRGFLYYLLFRLLSAPNSLTE
jgi:hypothetical protein